MITAYTRTRTIDLVLADLCAHPVGTLIEDAVRSIAARIGRSPGAISPALKRLADDGWIERLSDAHGTLIEVLRTDQQTDRSVSVETPAPEPSTAAAPPESPFPTDQLPDRMSAALGSDQESDRSACMVDHESKTQEEESARTPPISITTDPLYRRLIAQPRMNRKLAERIANNPPGTLADFEADLKLAQFAKTPFFFTVGLWRDGQRVIAPEEAPDDRPSRPAPAAGAGRRSAPSTAQRLVHPIDNAAARAAPQRPGARGLATRPKPYVTGATEQSIARALAGD